MGGVAESPFHRNFGERSILPNIGQCDPTPRKTAQSNPPSNGYATLAEKQMQISNRNAVGTGNRRGRQFRVIESFFDEYPNALEQARPGILVQRFLVLCQRGTEHF
jgi:hypothetical protein